MNKRFFLCLMIACISILRGIWIIQSESVSAAEILVNYSFGYFEININSLFNLSMEMFTIIAFQIVEGIAIYNEFCIAGSYVFSRCPNRRSWLINQYVLLAVRSIAYTICWYIPPMLLGFITGNIIIEDGVVILFLYQCSIYSMWLLTTAVIISCLAMVIGSYKGEMVFIFIQFIMIGIMSLWSENGILSVAIDNTNRENNFKILEINPITHLILAFHSFENITAGEYINVYKIEFPIANSIFVMLGVCLVALFVGLYMINKIDLLMIDKMR